MRADLARELNVGEDRLQVRWLIFSRVKFKIPQYYCSQNEKFTSQKSSTLVLAYLPLTRFLRRNNYPGSLLVLFKFVEKNVCVLLQLLFSTKQLTVRFTAQTRSSMFGPQLGVLR